MKSLLLVVFMAAALAAVADQNPDRLVIGAKFLELSAPETKDLFRLQKLPPPPEGGLLVAEVASKSPAEESEVAEMDVLVVKIGGKTIEKMAAWQAWQGKWVPGKDIEVDRWRTDTNRFGTKIWRRSAVKINPITAAEMEDNILRCSYAKLDGKWTKLPKIHPNLEYLPLQTLTVAAYGKFENGEVIQVLTPSSFTAKIQLQNSEVQSVRITGKSTEGLTDDRAFAAFPILIVGTWKYTTVLGASRTILDAVPLQVVKQGLSDSDLASLKKWLAETSKASK